MNTIEIKSILILCIIIFLRMLGIFMMLPTLTTYGTSLNGANELLIGIAIGIYGLMQAIFQIPFGMISDKIGRKTTVVIGLIIFIFGSIIAASTNNICGLILGRAIQGSGAISSVIINLLLELIDDRSHIKAMTTVGILFAVTFIFGTVIGPIISYNIGINKLFWIIVILNSISLIITLFLIPNINTFNINIKTINNGIKNIVTNYSILKSNISILILNFLLILNFIIIPNLMNNFGISKNQQWKVYLTVTLLSFLIISFLNRKIIRNVEKNSKIFFVSCITFLIISQILLLLAKSNMYVLLIAIQIFFLSFNIIEIILPTLINKGSPLSYKGLIMGIYLVSQFIGIALGGVFGGLLLHTNGIHVILLFEILISLIWLLIILILEMYPSYIEVLNIKILKNIDYKNEKLIYKIQNHPGIIECVINTKKNIIHIKFDIRKTHISKVKKILLFNTKKINVFKIN